MQAEKSRESSGKKNSSKTVIIHIPKTSPMLKKNIYRHIRSDIHKINSEGPHMPILLAQLKYLDEEQEKKSELKDNEIADLWSKQQYFEFIAFCLKENYSF
jgi:hypothetical protein